MEKIIEKKKFKEEEKMTKPKKKSKNGRENREKTLF